MDYLSYFFCFAFWSCCPSCGILVPWPGIELMPPPLEAQTLNYWTTREVPTLSHFDARMQNYKLAHILNQHHPNLFVLTNVPTFRTGRKDFHYNFCVISAWDFIPFTKLRQILECQLLLVGHGGVIPAWNTFVRSKTMLSQDWNMVFYHQTSFRGNHTAFLCTWLVFST